MQGAKVLRNDQQQQQVERASEAETVQATATSKKTSTRELIKINQLIDLTEKPIQLKREDIGWLRVRANASNCICCCANSSITLVTTNDSYILDHIPLDDVLLAEANPSLAYLAMSNRRKLAIIDLVENNIALASCSSSGSSSINLAGKFRTSTKVVNLSGAGLSIADVILWRWIDESVLGILTQESLFTCQVEQTRISHPATRALSESSQPLSIEKVCDLHPNLSGFCQISSIQRDQSSNLYAITGLYLPSDYLNWVPTEPRPQQGAAPISAASRRMVNFGSSSLKHSFSSVPGRLSQLAYSEHSFDSLSSVEKYTDLNNNNSNNSEALDRPEVTYRDEVCGLVQIHCKLRDRSQVIPAQAAAFTSSQVSFGATETTRTTLIVANRAGDKIGVHFIGMATTSDLTTSGQNAAPSKRLSGLPGENKFDFPTSIVCCPINDLNASSTHEAASDQLAMVTTKYGQLFVCSIQCGTILFNVRITNDAISSTVLESKTGGLMVIGRNGQVILVQVDRDKVLDLLQDRPLRLVNSLGTIHSFRTSDRVQINTVKRNVSLDSITNEIDSLDIGLNVIESTKF